MYPEPVQTGVIRVAVIGEHPQHHHLIRLLGDAVRALEHGEVLRGRGGGVLMIPSLDDQPVYTTIRGNKNLETES